MSVALIGEVHRVGIKARVFPEAGKSGFGKLEMEISSGQCFLKSIFEMLNTYMNGSLIYKSAGIALVGENRGVIGVRLGVTGM